MLARLLENQTLDTWMTYELMGSAIEWVQNKQPLGIELEMDEKIQTRDQATSTTAELLKLADHPVDSFYNFMSIRVGGGGAAGMRHQNRPDGMFLIHLKNASGGPSDMVLFYEGDAHGKDDGKNLDSGCKNSHKMYQAIAQAQSKNPQMAGCIIFAAMKDAPTDEMLPFLADMLKAHIFVCIAIADWNSKIRRQNRPTTLIGSIFGNDLDVHMKYDFVFGINIGLEGAAAGYNQIDFDHRIATMVRAIRLVNSNVELRQVSFKYVYSSEQRTQQQ